MQGLIIVIIAAAAVGIGVLVWKRLHHKTSATAYGFVPMYQRRECVLNRPERALYDILNATIGSHVLVLPKLRATNLVAPPNYDHDLRAHWQRLQRRCVDFVLCTPNSLSPVLAIKLESRSERKHREMNGVDMLDDALEVAELPLLRLREKDNYDSAEIVRQIRTCLARARDAAAEQADPNATTEVLASPAVSEALQERPLQAAFDDSDTVETKPFWLRFVRKQLPTFRRWSTVPWITRRRARTSPA